MMTKKVMCMLVVLGALFITAPAFGEDAAEDTGVAATADNVTPSFVLFGDRGAGLFGGAIGAAIIIIGGAGGLSRIGTTAAESMARQPEASGSVNGIAIITAAMVEGATLIAVIACILAIVFA
ncbi:MAG: ATP synthase F0 subunit C [Planctomycetota bacterium]